MWGLIGLGLELRISGPRFGVALLKASITARVAASKISTRFSRIYKSHEPRALNPTP